MRLLFVTWERHRRTREIAAALDAQLAEFVSSATRVRRYASLAVKTTSYLSRVRPSHVLVQCPSVVLAVLTLLLRPLLRYRVLLDLHNEAIEPYIFTSSAYQRLRVYLHRSADLSIVTNQALSDVVRANGGRPFVLPDRVPDLPEAPTSTRHATSISVVFICTYAPDEPFQEVFEAARLLGDAVQLHVTGRVPSLLDTTVLPANVRLTGFLPEHDYERLLIEAAVVVDLTSMDNCLVCGAYESVAMGKALVTSDTRALRAHFRMGTVYTRHDAESIATAVQQAIAERATLEAQMPILRAQLKEEWMRSRKALVAWLDDSRSARDAFPDPCEREGV